MTGSARTSLRTFRTSPLFRRRPEHLVHVQGRGLDLKEVARKLGVSHVLEGSVRKAGNRVRITAQLIDGAKGDHVVGKRYDSDLRISSPSRTRFPSRSWTH